jgi:hypothetical protein
MESNLDKNSRKLLLLISKSDGSMTYEEYNKLPEHLRKTLGFLLDDHWIEKNEFNPKGTWIWPSPKGNAFLENRHRNAVVKYISFCAAIIAVIAAIIEVAPCVLSYFFK